MVAAAEDNEGQWYFDQFGLCFVSNINGGLIENVNFGQKTLFGDKIPKSKFPVCPK